MSIAELAFYKENYGFMASKIKVSVSNNSFIGKTVTATKDGNVIKTAVVGNNGIAEIITDESGYIEVSLMNGAAKVAANVNVTYYGTYYATL